MLTMMRVAYPSQIIVGERMKEFGPVFEQEDQSKWQGWFEPLVTTSTLEDYG